KKTIKLSPKKARNPSPIGFAFSAQPWLWKGWAVFFNVWARCFLFLRANRPVLYLVLVAHRHERPFA
ncbi:MAG: hypothetical protein LBT38_03455, partial [Deltaproteobacteria bacterium]|nr:hypothetical protein [Deltaproteobacteria bacterium]